LKRRKRPANRMNTNRAKHPPTTSLFFEKRRTFRQGELEGPLLIKERRRRHYWNVWVGKSQCFIPLINGAGGDILPPAGRGKTTCSFSGPAEESKVGGKMQALFSWNGEQMSTKEGGLIEEKQDGACDRPLDEGRGRNRLS